MPNITTPSRTLMNVPEVAAAMIVSTFINSQPPLCVRAPTASAQIRASPPPDQTTGLMYFDLSARQRTTQNAESGIARRSPRSDWNTAPQKKNEKMTPA